MSFVTIVDFILSPIFSNPQFTPIHKLNLYHSIPHANPCFFFKKIIDPLLLKCQSIQPRCSVLIQRLKWCEKSALARKITDLNLSLV